MECSSSNQAALLEIGAKIDVILVQEPRVKSDKESINQAEYTLFEPSHVRDKYFKTLTYMRNDISASSIPNDNH